MQEKILNKNPLVSIIILNWNGAALLPECIESVIRTTYRPVEILLVDNASTDNSLEIAARYSVVKLIRNDRNKGYAGGNNAGFAHAEGSLCVTLNNDLVVDPEWLNEAVKLFRADETIGIVSCRQMNYYHRDKIDTLFSHPASYLLLQPTHRGEVFGTHPRHTTVGAAIGANGASAMYRKKLLEELGGFEEFFFAYQEECDLHMRAFLAGWKCMYVPSAIVYHKGSASFDRVKDMFFYYHERNRIWFIYRNMPAGLILHNFLILLYRELRTMINLVFISRVPLIYLRARFDGLRGMIRFSKIRKENMRKFRERKEAFRQLYKCKLIPLESKPL